MLQNNKKQNILFIFVIIMLVASIMLPFSVAFLSSSDVINNGNDIRVPNISFTSDSLIEYSQDSGFGGDYYFTNSNNADKTVSITINSNVPVILRVSNMLEIGTMDSKFIPGNSGEWYYYNEIINPNNSSSVISILQTSQNLVKYDVILGVEVFQANLAALNNMVKGDAPAEITALFN